MSSKSSASPPAQRNWIWPALIVVVVVLGIVAVVSARNTSSEANEAVDSRQAAEISVEGTPLAPLPAEGADPSVGVAIPTVVGQDFTGDPVTVGPDEGAQVIMAVAHWCPHCQVEVPRVMDHLADNPMPDDVELVMLSTSVKSAADNYPPQSWLEREGWTGATLVDSADSQAAAAMGVSGFPYFVAVDADGNVTARTSGEISNEQFDQLVAAAQA